MNQLKQKLQNEIENVVGVGYILYIYDSEKMNSTLYPLLRIQPSVKIGATNEVFSLDKPAFQIEGKPVFICIRNCPYSIEFEMLKEKFVDDLEDVDKPENSNCRVIEKKYSASEIDARVGSVYYNQIFRKKAIDSITIVIFVLSILLAIAITVIILNQIHTSEMNTLIEAQQPALNLMGWFYESI